MRIIFKLPQSLLNEIRDDLARPHAHARERVGFIVARCTRSNRGIVICASRYENVPDDGYLEDDSVGAMMNHQTILAAMQIAYSEKVSIFHVHDHGLRGRPRFSPIDLRESAKFVPAFQNVRPEYPHGAIVLSETEMSGLSWMPGTSRSRPINQFTIVGPQLRKIA